MVKLVDTVDSKYIVLGRAGPSPAGSNKYDPSSNLHKFITNSGAKLVNLSK